MFDEVHGPELALFKNPDVEVGTRKKEWITIRPVNSLTDGSAIEFSIPGTAMTYIDLKETLLHVKAKIIKTDGSNLESSDNVGLTNNSLHSLFS